MVLKWFANLFSSSKKAGNKQDMSSDDESFEEYSKSHGLDTLYAELATALDTHRPADPHSFLCEYFDNRKFTSNNSKVKSQLVIPRGRRTWTSRQSGVRRRSRATSASTLV